MARRSLYQCSNARVLGEKIYCKAGHELFKVGGRTPMLRLQRGAPLELVVCQGCKEFSFMGEPVPPKERGWK
jgi:hypothetical protein